MASMIMSIHNGLELELNLLTVEDLKARLEHVGKIPARFSMAILQMNFIQIHIPTSRRNIHTTS